MTTPLVHCTWTLDEAEEVLAVLDPLSSSATIRRAREWLLGETLMLRDNLRRAAEAKQRLAAQKRSDRLPSVRGGGRDLRPPGVPAAAP